MEEKIRKLFKKYIEGSASIKEQQAIEDFFEKMQDDGVAEETVSQDRLLKVRLDKKIYRETIHKYRVKRMAMLVAAASLLVFFSSALLVYLTREDAITTVIAQHGKQLKVVLPDSSIAYLNSGSWLTYSKKMGGASPRTIRLSGEAYFEVKHNPSRPFIVESETLKTRVLGTRFVVSDYSGEASSVVVRSGKVGVERSGKSETTIVEKDERVSYSQGQTLVETVKAEDYYSWKDGKIVFNQADLKQVMVTLNRRFNVRIQLTSAFYKKCTVTGSYYDDSIEDVLKSLQFIYGIEYSVGEGGVICLKANPC